MYNGQTRLYEVLMGNGNPNASGGTRISTSGSGGGSGSPLDFFKKRGKSIENALGTTGSAIADFFKTGVENTTTEQSRKDNKTRMNDIAKKYGYNSWSDWQDANAAARESGDTEAIKKFDEQLKEFQAQANENKAKADKKAADYKDYRENSYVGQKINQDPGKFAGSAINTLSTGVDVASMVAGGPANPLINTLQGGVEGLADELEEGGFQNFNKERALSNMVSGAAAGLATGGLNKAIGGRNLIPAKGKVTELAGKALNSGIGRGAMSGAVGGAVGAGTSAALNGQDIIGSAVEGAKQGAIGGAVAGGVIGGANRLTNAALNKFSPETAQKMQNNAQAWEKWKNSGSNFDERLTNTLTSGESGVGNWVQGKQSKTLGRIGDSLGNRVQDVSPQTAREVMGGSRGRWENGEWVSAAPEVQNIAKNAYDEIVNRYGVDDANAVFGDTLGYLSKNGADYDAGDGASMLNKAYQTAGKLQNGGEIQNIMEQAGYSNNTPTTAGGWLKKAGSRAIEDLNNKGVGLSLKDVSKETPRQNYVGVDTLGNRTEYTPDEFARLIQEYDNYKAPETLSGNSSSEVFEAIGPAGDELLNVYKTMNGGVGADPYNRQSWGEFESWLNKQRTATPNMDLTGPERADEFARISDLPDKIDANRLYQMGQNDPDLQKATSYVAATLADNGERPTYDSVAKNNWDDVRAQYALAKRYQGPGEYFDESIDRINGLGDYTMPKPGSTPQAFTMPREIMDAYQTINSRYNDPSKMSFETTPKGNTRLYYDGRDTGVTYRALPDDIKEDLRLEGLWREPADANINAGKFANAESKYYDMLDRVNGDDYRNLDNYLYNLGADDLRYTLQGLQNHYSALLHGEVTSDKFRGEYNNEMAGMIKEARNLAAKTGDPEAITKTKEITDFIEQNPLPTKYWDDGTVNETPTTAKGWLKQAGRRALEDINDKGVGLSLKKVDNQQFPEDIRNMQVNNNMENIPETEITPTRSAVGNTPETEVYRALQPQAEAEPIDLSKSFETDLGDIQQRNRLQAAGQQLRNAAQTQKYKAVFDSLDAKTAKRAAETNAPQKLADLGVKAQDYNEYAKTSSYINRVVTDLANKSGVKVNAPDLPSQLSPENIDVVMSDTALRKYNDYIKKITPDGDSPSQYSAGYLLEKSREIGNKAANLRGNSDDVSALRQALTDAKYTLRDTATKALENSGITGDATNDMIANGLKKLGANEKVQDYYTDAVDGKAPSVSDYIRRSSLFEQARDMGTQIDAEKYTRSASKAPTNPMTRLWLASGLDQPVETLLKGVIAPTAAKATDLAGRALQGAGNVQAKFSNGEGGIIRTDNGATPTTPTGRVPSQAIWNEIGRTEGTTQGEQARTANYLANAVNNQNANAQTLEDFAVPNTNSATSVYDSMYGTAQPTAGGTVQTQQNSYFPATGDYWTDILGVALTSAIDANDGEAFATLYGMYQDAAAQAAKSASSASSSSEKLSDTQRRAYAAENALDELSAIEPDAGYNLSKIPVVGDIATLGGNQYKSATNSLATQIGYMMSGANITPAEAERIGNSYVPQPFDSETTRRQKLERARGIIERYKGSAGGTETVGMAY